jgi:L-alanine-DL-glutamate epimerase-like enolase superfamily enzyme
MTCTLLSLTADALSVPLVDPFVIATGRVTATRSVRITARLRDASGAIFEGLGEAACLPPVTREDQPDALAAVHAAAPGLLGLAVNSQQLEALGPALDVAFPDLPVARSGTEMALLDALARSLRVPLYTLLGGVPPGQAKEITTDITLPILPPERMRELAVQWWGLGFRAFKLKVGKSIEDDRLALLAIQSVTPEATLRLDANCGFSAAQALSFLASAKGLSLAVECFEQPCAADDLAGMAEVTRQSAVPVLADESVKSLSDLQRVQAAKAAHGVNLKVAKSGGLLPALAIGQAARRAGMPLMVGGMVETRLGMTAAAHLAAALGGVEFADLDTAWLLRDDPFSGGYQAQGPRYQLTADPGLGVNLK